ncbi:MAG: nucleotidyltransferase family protein [Candidatus Cyclonatronum sp.]|uniref:nucleotidyltransferase family protein n=1 Tax=Cyclonatronum sp. TaxID=3024185 RepID=UPI0025BFA0E8|nr:nucleotidyltransferase family protein [Cyclonatronum sp.]MCH8487521.1 nucleotidyltransferase family protein [Cyclonatronum sp.]
MIPKTIPIPTPTPSALPYYTRIITDTIRLLFDQHFGKSVFPQSGSESGSGTGSATVSDSAVQLRLLEADYELIHDLFIKNGTAGLFSNALESGLLELQGDEHLQQRFRTDLTYFANFARFRELRTNEVLVRLEQILQEKGFPYVILKGLAIKEAALYPEAWLRMSSDIDLLIEKKRVYEVAFALLDNGFQLSLNKMFNLLDYSWQRNAEGFVFLRDKVGVEVHHSLHENSFLKWEDEQIWNPRLHSAARKQGCRHVFGLEMLLIHLLTHYFKHIHAMQESSNPAGHKFIWIVDLYAILRSEQQPVDWQLLKEHATGVLNCYEVCLFVLDAALHFFPELWGCIPQEIQTDLAAERERNQQRYGISAADYAHLIRPNASESAAIARKMKLHPMKKWSRIQRALYKYTILFPPVKTLQVHYNYRGTLKLPLCYLRHVLGMLRQRIRKA